MSSARAEEIREYAFADQALALRKRAGLTQRELARLLGVTGHAVQAWEAGLSYPATERLKGLIALYLERGSLAAGREEEEAAALWTTVRAKAARRTEPFDPAWFAALSRATNSTAPTEALPLAVSTGAMRRHDWGDVPATPVIKGRAEELASLALWVGEGRCRVVQVLGAGGIGKTAVAARLAYELAPSFGVVYWRSLRNALPIEDWLTGAIAALSIGHAVVPQGFAARLVLLLELLRAHRTLLVLDNLETVLEPGAPTVRFRAGYEGYGAVLARLAEGAHQGCLLLTSREQPLTADDVAVRSLRLEGLEVEEVRALLGGRGLMGDDAAWRALVARYAGNPLALNEVGETVRGVFGGDIAAFLGQEVAVFGGIRQLLDEQIGRLSGLERAIVSWLAVEQEPVGFAELVADLGPGVARAEAVEAVEVLRRRSLLEWSPGATFTLQPVVLEYTTTRLVATLAQEILAGDPVLLLSQPLLKVTASEQVRRGQERRIARPLVEQLNTSLGGADAVDRQLLALLDSWRGRSTAEQGYGPGNVVTLLRLSPRNLSGLDITHIAFGQDRLPENITQSTPAMTTPSPQTASAYSHAPPPVAAPAPASAPTNLPPARTSFVGRTEDLAALTDALGQTTRTRTRLITLSGAAGSGKTRLALRVAEELLDAYSDGVWLVELAPLPASAAADPTTVVAATLSRLGLLEQPGQTSLDTLVMYLRAKHLLLVLDNCEHVAAACAALAALLLAACPELQILTTSQQALGHLDETVWPVTILDVPPALQGMPAPEAITLLARTEAVQLFVERARAVQPGFVLSAANAAVVVAICRQLDGLPLAIELAAARLYVLPVEEVLARLNDRFRLLRRGGRIAIDRHQTLQATLDWSYGLLDPTERALLRRLAMFSGGWEVGAAEVVCAWGEVAAEAVLELLDELLDRSLIYIHEAGGVPRFGALETVRQYGLQQLERAGEATALRDRHLDWCVALVEQVAPALRRPGQMVRLEREHDNLRAALQWALDRSLSTPGLRVAGGLGRFWLRGGHQREGQRWLEALLALPNDDQDDTAPAARATALEAAAWLADDRHDFAQATALFAQAGALRRALGGEQQPGWPLVTAAMAARADGDYPRATALLEESLAEYRRLGHQERTSGGSPVLSLSWRHRYTQLALVLREQGEYARASALYEECLALATEREEAEDRAIALLGLGDIARDQGDAVRVRAYCEEASALFRALGQQWAVGFLLNNLALAAYLDGDLALAASRAQESEAFFRERQAGPSLAEVLVSVGLIKGAQGEATAARASLAEALALAWTKGPRLFVAASLEEFGLQAVRQGHRQDGVQILGAAAALREAMGAPIRPADRRAVEDALAAARTSLGSMSFEEAWSLGQSVPVEQIVAWVVAGSEDGPAKTASGGQPRRMDHTAAAAPASHPLS